MDPLSLLWLFFILASLQPGVQRQVLLAQRRRALHAISREREATVMTLIHRQEAMSLLGFPIVRYIDIDDAEGVLRAIHETPPGRAIEIILHTPGGLVIAARQIASALADHDGRVTAVVPHYAMSGGTLIALAADEIVIDPHAALGPVDPQLGQYPAASLVEVAKQPGNHDDQTLIMADVGRKAIAQVEAIHDAPAGAAHAAGTRARRGARAGVRRLDARPSAPGPRPDGARPAGPRRRAAARARADGPLPAAARPHARGRVRARPRLTFGARAAAGAPGGRPVTGISPRWCFFDETFV